MTIQYWILDFDETLASGVLTWALEFAFPTLIERHALPYDADRFNTALLSAQERAAQRADPRALLHDLFTAMDWSADLESELFADVTQNYRPALFPDTLPFLEAVAQRQQTAFILSNNPHSVATAAALGIGDAVRAIFTPKSAPALLPKPDVALWRALVAAHPQVTPENSAIVGDDPWSEGEFAARCGVRCWIVDRKARFAARRGLFGVEWVETLTQLPAR